MHMILFNDFKILSFFLCIYYAKLQLSNCLIDNNITCEVTGGAIANISQNTSIVGIYQKPTFFP